MINLSLASSITLMPQACTMVLSIGGTELNDSRRVIDFDNAEAIRWQYNANNSISVRLDYSLDNGSTWSALADEYDTFGTAPRITAWQTIPPEAKTVDVLVRAVGVGVGLLTTVSFVEVQYR